jgi:GTP pyrophosphokinase
MDALKSEIKDHLKRGHTMLDEKIKEFGIKPQARVYRKLTIAYGLTNRQELFSKIGAGLIDLSDLGKMLKKNSSNKIVRYWNLQFSRITGSEKPENDMFDGDDDDLADKDEIQDEATGVESVIKASRIDKKKDYLLKEDPLEKTLSYQVARCCRPIPGDKVIGFINDNEEVIVHKNSCPEAIQLASRYGEKIVKAKWSKHTVLSFLARISMRGIDRIGILNDLTQYITLVLSVNIRKIFIETHDGIFEGFIDLYVHSTEDLDKLIKQMSLVKGVESIQRTEIKED